jgi:RimJ/RimL family protein N-acetyltransferase
MLPSFRNEIPVLVPMFDMIDQLEWEGKALSSIPYFVMGQTCVAKSHRGMGVFDALYLGLKASFKGQFDYVVTEISKRNQRSWRAHQRVGFRLIHEYEDPSGEIWLVVIWKIS